MDIKIWSLPLYIARLKEDNSSEEEERLLKEIRRQIKNFVYIRQPFYKLLPNMLYYCILLYYKELVKCYLLSTTPYFPLKV
jgi:hypothetical protein